MFFFNPHQKLTGGVMLSRNNEFIVLYRGKDFLSSELAKVLLKRERLAKSLQDEEEARRKAASLDSILSSGNIFYLCLMMSKICQELIFPNKIWQSADA